MHEIAWTLLGELTALHRPLAGGEKVYHPHWPSVLASAPPKLLVPTHVELSRAATARIYLI